MNKKKNAPQKSRDMVPNSNLQDDDLEALFYSSRKDKSPQELDNYIKDIGNTVRHGVEQNIAMLTPWFFKNMPLIYYQTTPRSDKVRHLSAIISGHIFDTKQTVELWNSDRTEVTFIGPGNDNDVLINMVKKIDKLNINVGSLYFSHDKLLFLATFMMNSFQKADMNNDHIKNKIKSATSALLTSHPAHKSEINKFVNNLDHNFVMYGSTRRIEYAFNMILHMLRKEGVHTIFEPYEGMSTARLSIGLKEVRATENIESIISLIHRYGYNIIRSFVVQFEENYEEPITVLNFIIFDSTSKPIELNSVPTQKLIKALRTLGWVDTDDYSQLTQEPYNFSVNATNLVRSVASWVHILLSKENPYYFSEHKIMTAYFQYSELLNQLVDFFQIRFSPLTSAKKKRQDVDQYYEKIKKQIDKTIDPVERQIFKESLRFIKHILITNYHFRTKTGLAFRLDSAILDPKFYPNKPYGIFFVSGRDYRMFHVRWKDIARGGLRVVMPNNHSEYKYALAGLFDEVYGLSYAQQMKNKDIPEGGSKGVMIVRPSSNKTRAAKGAVNALLDLLVQEEETKEEKTNNLISYYLKEEIVFLGPDENITNELIEWFTQQARRRGFKYSNAFMSSKPTSGINHKEFGVTSEGLNVFVDRTLKYLKIDPKKEKFTVKMTGGPDGDVAGNEIKFLYREYKENARVVAVADGFGAAYDPEGLNWQELLKLVKENKSIDNFNPKKLSKNKKSFVIDAITRNNILKRNELHFKVFADLFIPAGGRPFSINLQNCDNFIDNNNKATCRAIVEGANIFFTNEARTKIQESGIFMVKDSTANKTGVICSSYEIIASLILSEDEFIQIKKQYVNEVIGILRSRAAEEAALLFREFEKKSNNKKRSSIEISLQISVEINKVTDHLLGFFTKNKEQILKDPHYKSLVYQYCPNILVEKYKNRILKKLPESYIIALISANMASSVIYNEGLGWLDSIEQKDLVKAVTTYIQNLENTSKLIASIDKSNLKDKTELNEILTRSGARVMTNLSLEKANSAP